VHPKALTPRPSTEPGADPRCRRAGAAGWHAAAPQRRGTPAPPNPEP